MFPTTVEIVSIFIGREFDDETLIDRFDDCVLTDREVSDDWEAYPDPFGSEDRRELALSNQ